MSQIDQRTAAGNACRRQMRIAHGNARDEDADATSASRGPASSVPCRCAQRYLSPSCGDPGIGDNIADGAGKQRSFQPQCHIFDSDNSPDTAERRAYAA